MNGLENQVRTLFDAYGKRSNDALRNLPEEDIEAMVDAFAPFFVESSPRGVVGVANDDKFKAMVPDGFSH